MKPFSISLEQTVLGARGGRRQDTAGSVVFLLHAGPALLLLPGPADPGPGRGQPQV